MSYIALIEGMDAEERRDFDAELVSGPGEQVSRGVDQLMAVMRQTKPPPKTRPSKPQRQAPTGGKRKAKKGGV